MSSSPLLCDAGKLQKASALIIPCFVYLAILGVPLNFSAIIDIFSVEAAVATIATTVEIAAIAMASMFVSLALPKLNPRIFYIFGVLVAALGQMLTLLTKDFSIVVGIRGFVGVGEGVILGVGFASLAQMQGGKRLLGMSSGITAGICFMQFMLVPMMAEKLGAGAVFWFLSVGFICMIPLSFYLPNKRIVKDILDVSIGGRFSGRNVSLFIMCLLISIGANSLWLYFDQIGKGLGLSAVEIGLIGSVSMLVAILVPFTISASNRLKGVYPLLVGCFLMALTCYLYVSPINTYVWAFVVIYMTFVYLFVLACARVFSADLDLTGSTTAAVGAADVLGMVVGPILVAVFLPLENSLVPLAHFATAALVLCVVPAIYILRSKKVTAACCGRSLEI